MFILISYDIENDRLRNRVASLLEAHGRRVQYSVFECHLTDAEFAALKKLLASVFSPRDADPGRLSIRFYPLCRACVDRAEVFGDGTISTDEPFYIV